MALTKDEAAKEKADIQAAEQVIRERWCRLEGHRWDLPQPNPLNSDSLACALRCNRCNVTATLTIAVEERPSTSVSSAPNVKPAAAPGAAK